MLIEIEMVQLVPLQIVSIALSIVTETWGDVEVKANYAS